jgi:putative FmdB family regulatory protein
MPIFEYRCAGCGGTFELLVRSGGQAVSCPTCGADRVSKLFSSFATVSASAARGAGSRSSCGSCSGSHCSTCH